MPAQELSVKTLFMPRHYCQTCQRPIKVCYCSSLVPVANRLKLTILQHPLEQKHPFNTGRMAHLCLENSQLIIAETLEESLLENLLQKPSALLYPSLPWLAEPITSDKKEQSTRSTDEIQQLIVIDATWRKSKKILHLHPQLQRLPRISLSGDLKSNYQIRKTRLDNALSTIESVVLAMQSLEPQTDFSPLLTPFEAMIKLQQAHTKMPASDTE